MFKVRTFDAKTLSWWYNEREDIDMNPLYQRRSGLWSQKDKSYLIDSILNEYDIPKIYLADFTIKNTPLNEKNKSYAVIDGKQRLEAIFDFFDGKLILDNDFILFDDLSLKLGGLSYKDLKQRYPKVANKFDNFNLSVMSVFTDDESKINDLFVRLNRSKPLTGAELRNAMEGLIPVLIRNIADHNFFQSKIKFKTNRGQDRNSAAKIILIEFRGEFVDTKKTHLDRFVEEGLRSENIKFERAANDVSKNLDIMCDIFIENDPLLSSQGPVTLYYWFIRNCDEKDRRFIREFLVRFESSRKRNRQLTQEGEEKIDEELLTYDIKNRSVDDKLSLKERYNILVKRFKAFKNLTEVDFLSKRFVIS